MVKRRYFRCRVSESKLATKYLGTSTEQTRRESEVSHRSASHTLTDLRARGRGVLPASMGPRGHLRLRCQRCAVPGSVPRPARSWAFGNPEGGPRGKGRRQWRGSSRSPHVPGGQTHRCVWAHMRTPRLHSVSSSGSRGARGRISLAPWRSPPRPSRAEMGKLWAVAGSGPLPALQIKFY